MKVPKVFPHLWRGEEEAVLVPSALLGGVLLFFFPPPKVGKNFWGLQMCFESVYFFRNFQADMEAMGTEAEGSGKSEEEKIEESRNTKRFVSFHEKKDVLLFY